MVETTSFTVHHISVTVTVTVSWNSTVKTPTRRDMLTRRLRRYQ